MNICRGYVGVIFGAMAIDCSILLLPCSITAGVLGSPDLLLSCSEITVALYITIIVILTHKSYNPQITPKSTDTSTNTGIPFPTVDLSSATTLRSMTSRKMISSSPYVPKPYRTYRV